MNIGETLYRRNGRAQWEPRIIRGETRTSWIIDGGTKVAKDTLELRAADGRGRLYTAAQRDEWEWERAARPRLHALIDQADTATLRAYAALLEDIL